MTRVRLLCLLAALTVVGLAAATACGVPQPTRTPPPPQPPRIIGRVPEPGQEQGLKAPIALVFDQAMDKASVEAAFSISPTLQGAFEWQGNRLLFTPAGEGLQRATTYQVTLQDVRSAAGQVLSEPYRFSFNTVGFLEITGVQPANGTQDVAPDATITIMFNRPVVPLSAISQSAGMPQLLTIKSFAPPGVAGEGRWLNTSIYTFQPSPKQPFAPGTTYQVRVSAGLTDTTGGLLPNDYTWEFHTELPKVVSFECSDPEPFVGPSPAISVTFNMPMEHTSVESHFTLSRKGGQNPVAGTFHWTDKTIVFAPSTPLELESTYTLNVSAGVRASAGGEGSSDDAQWTFSTIALPRITQTFPANGDRSAEPYTSLQVTFSSPMQRDSLMPNLTILPTATDVYTSWDQYDTQLYISFGAKPSTAYTFVFGADMQGRYGQKLGKTQRITFTTKRLAPALFQPPDRVGSYNAYTSTVVAVQHVNLDQLDLALYRVERADFIQLTAPDWYQRWDKFRPAQRNLLRRWSAEVASRLNEYKTSLIPLGESSRPLAPGFYYLQITSPLAQDPWRQLFVVSHYNVTLKVTQNEALVWATDLSTGQGAPNLDVAVMGADGQALTSGRTGGDGILFSQWQASSAAADSLKQNPWASVVAFVGPDDDPCVASTDWSNGISPWQFNLSVDPALDPYRAYFYTDRTIYRPGQTVYFKGILRGDDDGRYSLPSSVKSMAITVSDDQGKEVFRADVPVNDMGTLNGEFTLADEAGLGFYSLNARLDEQHSYGTGFQVAEYRKPEYVVTVTTDRQEYVQGEQMQADVGATYYFGGPVSNSQVRWRLMSQDYFFRWTGKGDYSFSDADYDSRGKQTAYGELITSGSGTTDGQGHFTLKLPADIATRKNSQVFTLEASITDASNQEVSGRNSAIVHKGLFYIGLAPREYIGSAGRQSQVDIITVDSQSVSVTNVPLTVVLYEEHWYNVQQEADDGRFYWDWKLQENPVYTTTVTTDAAGTAVATFTPEKGGLYRVRAMGRDAKENQVRSSTYLWISSGDYVAWRQENNDRIELVTDKKAYKPGETARVLIPSPFQGQVNALLTVERGHILKHQLLTLSTNSDQVEIPILSAYAPNAYVSVSLVKGTDRDNPVAGYRIGYVNLNVSTQEKELNIAITPDQKASYRPSDKAGFEIRATDYQGHGVQAELSLQLVDLSVLALTDNTQGTLLNHFYTQRPLAVRTGTTLSISMDRQREQARSPEGKGGSGGEGGGPIRRDFPDTAYWNAEVRTDAAGKAQVSVGLPDNLTTWRMTGKAVTADTLVGEAQTDIVATKDLLLRSVAPRFFVVGDQVQLGAVVHNNTDKALSVNVSLEGKGVTVTQPAQKVEIAAHDKASVNWQAQVAPVALSTGQGGESAVLTWRASSGALGDALELTLPVYHYSTPEVVATAGQVPAGESRTELVYLPSRLDPSQGELTVQLDPSLAAGMRDGVKYLEEYPYDCIEQTVSRFLPNVITYRALKKLGIQNAELEARLPQYVSIGLQRIYALQHYDGGWGWWLADDSNPFISAYVVLGLSEAKDTGFAVDDNVTKRGIEYLRGVLDSSNVTYLSQTNVRAFILYVLANSGYGDLGRSVALYEKRESLSNYGKAYLALALQILEAKDPTHVRTLLSDLNSAAILSATGAHWEEAKADYWTMNTNARSTALVLDALVRADPQNALIPNVVRWLMTARKQGHWETTQETAWSVMALTDFMVSTGELQADYDYQVTLNAKTLGQGTVTTQNVGDTQKLVVAIKDLLRDESNRLVLERLAPKGNQTGQGQLYYSAYLRYFLPVEDVVALNRGIIVSRQYSLAEHPERSIDSARVGDVIQVKLTLIAPNDLHYLVLEDPLPAGCEALDKSLKTTSSEVRGPQLDKPEQRMPFWWFFTESELRDEKVALFAAYLSRGTYEYTYLIRASVPGRFLTMPANAYEMYFPEVFGRSDGGAFTVAP